MDITAFKWKTTVAEALNWGLDGGKSLKQELTDQAEQIANSNMEDGIEGFKDMEATVHIEIIDGYFVVTFHENDWRLSLHNGDEIFITDSEDELPGADENDPSYYGKAVTIHSIKFQVDSKGRTICQIVDMQGQQIECELEAIS